MRNESRPASLPWWPSFDARRTAMAQRRRARRGEQPPRRAGQPRGTTSLDQIVETALQIVDAEGLEALTVRRLAGQLGVGAMTVYSYIRDKDELLDLVVDRATGEVALPLPTGDWRTEAQTLAHNLRTTLLAHPAGIRLISERPMRGPNAFRLLETGLRIFREAGFSEESAAYAYIALGNYVLGCVLTEATTIGLRVQPAGIPKERLSLSASAVRQLPVDQFPNVTALAAYLYADYIARYEGRGPDDESPAGAAEPTGASESERRFDFGLESLLDGFAPSLGRDAPGVPELRA